MCRELNRNLYHQRYRARGPAFGPARTKPWRYCPHRSQLRADAHAARPKPAKLATNQRLRREVQDRLDTKHSPEQISRRLAVDFPNEPEMRVSRETIYQSIYVQGRGALRGTWPDACGPGRRCASRAGGRIPPRADQGHDQHQRTPAEVADRAVPGHWEGT